MPIPDISQFHLGRLPARQDARTLQFGSYVQAAALPAIPPAVAWSPKVTTGWPMLTNDRLGTCTEAGAGHMIQLWAAANGKIYAPSDPEIVAAYSAAAGYNPADPSTDRGTVILDLLNYWRNTGIAGHKILAFLSLMPSAHKHVMASIYLFGGCYVGLDMPLNAYDQMIGGSPWSVTSGPRAGVGAGAGTA